ncbi:MAG: hypothetical protein ABSF90_17545 [Syntrophobacteraceae bacterium]|jgi:hypothetical protein
MATAFVGGTGRISTLREAVHRYASAQPLDFLAPFGAALGNPEMAGRQTVRARTKNASFPNLKLLVSSAGFQDGHQSGARGKRPWYYDEQ